MRRVGESWREIVGDGHRSDSMRPLAHIKATNKAVPVVAAGSGSIRLPSRAMARAAMASSSTRHSDA